MCSVTTKCKVENPETNNQQASWRQYFVAEVLIIKEQHTGIVVSRFGNRAEVQDTDGERIPCHIRRALSELVTGDRVTWEAVPADDNETKAVITAIEERTSVLKRPIRYQGLKPVAANIDQVLVVTATEPPYSHRILDRYLVAIERSQIEAVIILNKTDLVAQEDDIYDQMTIYSNLGYLVIAVSCESQTNLNNLESILADKTSVFVGQSGVGKSSLVNQILPEASTEVSELSDNSGLGTHTTTTSRLYQLVNNALLIDSPGIREFGMDHLDAKDIAQGFVEINEFAQHCKFRDCQHIKEPGCAVKMAVENGKIHPQRYNNYCYFYDEAMQD